MSPPVEIVVPPAKKENLSWGGGGCQNVLPSRRRYRKKLNVFYINITTRQQFFISVGESTKTMLKQRFPNFFQIAFEIESTN